MGTGKLETLFGLQEEPATFYNDRDELLLSVFKMYQGNPYFILWQAHRSELMLEQDIQMLDNGISQPLNTVAKKT